MLERLCHEMLETLTLKIAKKSLLSKLQTYLLLDKAQIKLFEKTVIQIKEQFNRHHGDSGMITE